MGTNTKVVEDNVIIEADTIESISGPPKFNPVEETHKTRSCLAKSIVWSFLIYCLLYGAIVLLSLNYPSTIDFIFDKLATLVALVMGFYFGREGE